jgi:hypothetical protein
MFGFGFNVGVISWKFEVLWISQIKVVACKT